jgi:hypothetical protein
MGIESHLPSSRRDRFPPIIIPMGEPRPLAIFNDPRYHALGGVGTDRLLQVTHVEGTRPVGTLVAVQDGDTVTSGARAPYGGADLCDPAERTERVIDLWQTVIEAARARGAHTLEVRARPEVYAPAQRMSVMAMLHLGFAVRRCWLNHTVDVAAIGSVERYLDQIGPKARNMIRSVERCGLETTEATTEADWREGFDVLAANKAAKGRAMAYDIGYLLRLRQVFGTVARMVVTRHGGAPVAAAVTYRVGPGVELVTAWGDADHALPRSPMNLLALHLVERSLAEGTDLLDLGASTDGEARPNHGLARFKESVGGTAGYRLDLTLNLREHP